MALDKDRDRSQSPDRAWRRRPLNKRDILLQRELSANKQQRSESALIKLQTMNNLKAQAQGKPPI